MVLEALDNEPGTPRDIVALNAGAALYAADVAPIDRGRASSARARRSPAARRARSSTQFVAFTQKLGAERLTRGDR